MNKDTLLKSRLKTLNKVIFVILALILVKIVYMTTIEGDQYVDLANQKTYKRIMVQAPRGEIKDRNGIVLAGNTPEFTVQIVGDSFNQKGVDNDEYQNKTAYSLVRILEKNEEKYEDDFPIFIEAGRYRYTYDKKIEEFKSENGIPKNYSPKQCFYYITDSLIKNGLLSLADREKNPVDLQSKMNSLGYYPPILVSTWQFTEDKNKIDWLESYKLNSKTEAGDAFKKIRDSYYKIDKSISDREARKIMIVRNLLKSNIYTQYNPVTLAKGIKKETVAQIEENSMNLSGVSVAVKQKRVYPNKNLASHVLGYVGKIPSSKQQELLTKGYSSDSNIGLSGVEHSFEEKLKGKDGYKEVKVDSVGRVINEMKSVSPVSGSSLYLTIDSKLQTVAEESLERAINSARTGSTFKSQFGDISIGDVGPKAKSGAIVAMDVSSGDVLAMSSFPNYDPNKFAEGISASDYNNYLPKNQNDLLAPNPLLNLATQGAFQPGSTFKLITAMAALESGLNPEYTINDPGVIRMGNRNFADYIWHKSRKGHGIENLYKAIQESCNVYFYIIGSDKNWLTGQDLNLGMGAKKILDYAKKFGLDQETGLEGQLEQRNGKVPSEEQKIEKTKIQMKLAIEKTMKDHFEGIDYTKNNDLFENKVEEIVSWIDEDKPVGRSEAITRLKKLGVKSQYVTDDADYLVFSYINYAKWGVGDTFNLAIGQGENAYNPVQIARYVSAIANGGYLVNVNVVNKSESPNGKISEEANRRLDKISFKNDKNLEDLKIGMVRVSQQGLAKKAFENFPIKVASKTGTAEKTGKIPTDNEFAYLMSHLASYKVEKDKVIAKYEELKTEKEQELTKNKIEELKKKIASPQTSKDDKEKYEKELKNGVRVKLDNTDKINSFYLRKAIKLLNHKLTNEDIDSFKEDYGSFAWCVAFAPADNPKIAVACMIPQGESSSYAVLPIREVLGSYFKLKPNLDKKEADKKSDNDKNRSNKNNQEETNENDHIGSSNNEDRTNGYDLEGVD